MNACCSSVAAVVASSGILSAVRNINATVLSRLFCGEIICSCPSNIDDISRR